MPDLEYCECGAVKGLCEMGLNHRLRLEVKTLRAKVAHYEGMQILVPDHNLSKEEQEELFQHWQEALKRGSQVLLSGGYKIFSLRDIPAKCRFCSNTTQGGRCDVVCLPCIKSFQECSQCKSTDLVQPTCLDCKGE